MTCRNDTAGAGVLTKVSLHPQHVIQDDLEFFFCNAVLEIPFIFPVWHVNRPDFDLLALHQKIVCVSL